jgi:hypothetical protein
MTAEETSPRDTLLQMTNAFQVSQAIYAAATLGIADLLVDGPKSTDVLAEATGTHAPSTGSCERWPALAYSSRAMAAST